MLFPQYFWPIRLTSVVLECPIGAQPCRLTPHNSVLLSPCHLSFLPTNQMLSIVFNHHLMLGTNPQKTHSVRSKHRCLHNCENGVRNGTVNQRIFFPFKIDCGKWHIKTLVSLKSTLLKSFSMFCSYPSPCNENTHHAHQYSLQGLCSWPECQHRAGHLCP